MKPTTLIEPVTGHTRIVAEVERWLRMIEEFESAVTSNLQGASRLRQAILACAFRGIMISNLLGTPNPLQTKVSLLALLRRVTGRF